ncbi:MAG: beta-lactamase family protein [Nocardiaceae bacterium]|nr:beta-lactamase family protein [Nocardiaceae bacterium]
MQMVLPMGVHGHADARFATPVRQFGRLFAGHRGGGALAIYEHGTPVVDIWSGVADHRGRTQWDSNTAAVPFSATKGVAATVLHRLADRGLLDYDAPIAEYWPEFGVNGKRHITTRMVLTHQAGLALMTGVASNLEEMLDHRLMEQRLAAAKSTHHFGTSAYHSLTYGWLCSGIARAITGKGMAELFRTEIAEPIDDDGIHLGRPPADSPTNVSQFVGKVAFAGPVGQTAMAAARRLPGPVGGFLNTVYVPHFEALIRGTTPPILRSEMPAANGVLTARALGKMYSAYACNGETAGGRLLSASTVRDVTQVQQRSLDKTLFLPMNWRLGLHSFHFAGVPKGFGHIGFAGSGGWADPSTGLSVGFVHNRIGEARYFAYDQTILFWLSPSIVQAAKSRPRVLQRSA